MSLKWCAQYQRHKWTRTFCPGPSRSSGFSGGRDRHTMASVLREALNVTMGQQMTSKAGTRKRSISSLFTIQTERTYFSLCSRRILRTAPITSTGEEQAAWLHQTQVHLTSLSRTIIQIVQGKMHEVSSYFPIGVDKPPAAQSFMEKKRSKQPFITRCAVYS